MDRHNFTTTFTVDQTPAEVFAAINNVRGWWSEAIEGRTDVLGASFQYHYQDVHRCTFAITEFVPNERVVWHVVDNFFNFVKDKTEWIGTDVVFNIARQDDKTVVHFTHVGLVPAYECYEVCAEAWGSYVTGSLRDLITTGKGRPNPLEDVVEKARQMSEQSYTTTFTVEQAPAEVFAAILNVRGWWAGEIDGSTDTLGAEFTYSYEDQHRSTQKITELVPGKRVTWHVLDSHINFVKDQAAWTGTDIVFEITRKDNQTELHFTHIGLAPVVECYKDCSDAWSFYIHDSLRNLVTAEQGQSNHKGGETQTVTA